LGFIVVVLVFMLYHGIVAAFTCRQVWDVALGAVFSDIGCSCLDSWVRVVLWVVQVRCCGLEPVSKIFVNQIGNIYLMSIVRDDISLTLIDR
jgi:hypothetical protein